MSNSKVSEVARKYRPLGFLIVGLWVLLGVFALPHLPPAATVITWSGFVVLIVGLSTFIIHRERHFLFAKPENDTVAAATDGTPLQSRARVRYYLSGTIGFLLLGIGIFWLSDVFISSAWIIAGLTAQFISITTRCENCGTLLYRNNSHRHGPPNNDGLLQGRACPECGIERPFRFALNTPRMLAAPYRKRIEADSFIKLNGGLVLMLLFWAAFVVVHHIMIDMVSL